MKKLEAEKLLNPCPFCGENFSIQIRDAEGNCRPDEYIDDPWSGLSYSIKHHIDSDCPISSTDFESSVGNWSYKNLEELVKIANSRFYSIEAIRENIIMQIESYLIKSKDTEFGFDIHTKLGEKSLAIKLTLDLENKLIITMNNKKIEYENLGIEALDSILGAIRNG